MPIVIGFRPFLFRALVFGVQMMLGIMTLGLGPEPVNISLSRIETD